MKKKLLLMLLAVMGMSSVYADNYQVDDYIYTRNGKYKVTGENLIENGDFSNGKEGWTNGSGTELNVGTEATDTFLLRSTGGPKDGPYIYGQLGSAGNSTAVSKTNGLNWGNSIHKAVKVLDPGTYVVTYKVKVEDSNALWTSATINAGRWNNYENVFTNGDGDPATITKSYADWWTYQPGVWTEVAYNMTITGEGDDNINFVIAGHAGGLISFADFGVYPVQEVGDTRIVQDAIDMVKYFVENPDFPNDQETLDDVIAGLEDILNNEYDASTVRSTLYSLVYEEGCDFQSFLDANSVNVANYFTNFDFNAATTKRGTLPSGWSAPDGGTGRMLADNPAGAFTSILLRNEIQAGQDLGAAKVTQTVDLPGGKYIYIVQGSANRYGQDGRGKTNNFWWYRQGLKFTGVKCVVNGEEYEMDLPVNATEAKTFIYSFDTEDGDKTVGFSMNASTGAYGGNVRLDNIQFRLVGANQEDVDAYFNKSQMEQAKAALKVVLDSAYVVKEDPAYVFFNSVLTDSIETSQAVYNTDYKATLANVDLVKAQKANLEYALRSYYRANAELTALKATLAEAQALETDETRPKAKEELAAKNIEVAAYIAEQGDQTRDSLTLVKTDSVLTLVMTKAYIANATYSTPAKLAVVNPGFLLAKEIGWKIYESCEEGKGWKISSYDKSIFNSGRALVYGRGNTAQDAMTAWQNLDIELSGAGVYEFHSNAFGALTKGQAKGTEREIYMYLGPTTDPETTTGNYETANKVMVSSYCSNQGDNNYYPENSDPYVVTYIAPEDVTSIEFGMYKTATTGNCIAFSDCEVLYYGPYDAYKADSMRAVMAPTLAEFQESINAATELNKERYYVSADHETFLTAIGNAQGEHDRIAAAAYSETLFQELQDAIAQLAADVTTFKNSVKTTVLINLVDEISMTEGTVSGSVGTMTVSNYDTENFGFYVDADKAALRVGNGADTLKLTKVPDAEGILHISYDMYFGGFTKHYAFVRMEDGEGNRIAGYNVQPYSNVWADPTHGEAKGGEYDDLGIDWSKVSQYTNNAMDDMPAEYKNSFDIVYDMIDNTVTTTVNSAAPVKVDALTTAELDKIIIGSDYNNAARRCWIKNLKVEVIGNAVTPGSIKGDVNRDGLVNSSDVVRDYEYMSGQTEGVTKEDADVNGDGAVNSSDIVRIYEIMSGN